MGILEKNKMNYYFGEDFKKFLKCKNVLDSWRPLYASGIYLNYSLISKQMYLDIGDKNIEVSNGNVFYNGVEVLGFNYEANKLLNKLLLEYMFYICTSINSLLHYINLSLVLNIKQTNVKKDCVAKKLVEREYISLKEKIELLWDDEMFRYIREVYNHSKHNGILYGSSSCIDYFIDGKRNVSIPEFKRNGIFYKKRKATELFDYYEKFINEYSDILDEVYYVLDDKEMEKNRIYIKEILYDEKENNYEKPACNEVYIYISSVNDNYYIKNVDIELFSGAGELYIMYLPKKNTEHIYNLIEKIDIIENKNLIGVLNLNDDNKFDSDYKFYKYEFIKNDTAIKEEDVSLDGMGF